MVGAHMALRAEDAHVALSRLEPLFRRVDGGDQPLSHPSVSRKPIWLAQGPQVLRLQRDADGSAVLVDGRSSPLQMELPRSRLSPGVVVQIGHHIALLLHDRPPLCGLEDGTLGMVGASRAMGQLRLQVRRVAPYLTSVLLQGESGSGKELVARAIHDLSERRRNRFVAVNMATVPASMASSVLFGHARGAFTGAVTDHDGIFLQADGGTLFLDEVGEIPPDVQAGLLRVLEEKQIQRIGEQRSRKSDVRIVAATDLDLRSTDNAERMRRPLLFRLAGYQVNVPPLRDRVEDLPLLLQHFVVEQAGARSATELRHRHGESLLPPLLWPRLIQHGWPGNVREARNVAQRLTIDGIDRPAQELLQSILETLDPTPPGGRASEAITAHNWPVQARSDAAIPQPEPSVGPAPAVPPTTPVRAIQRRDLTWDAVYTALESEDWDFKQAARQLGVHRSTLYRWMEEGRIPSRLAEDVSEAEVQAALVQSGSSLGAARILRVSSRRLEQRVRNDPVLLSALRRGQDKSRWPMSPQK
jgi:two-component system nitrogen regulation response regulator GlnG